MAESCNNDRTYFCPVEVTIDVIGGKWKSLIYYFLQDGSLRFGELKKRIPGITQKMLTRHLREMEEDGIIKRDIYAEVPPRVEYSLTEYGLTLEPILNAMLDWGMEHIRRNNLHFNPPRKSRFADE